MNQVIHSVAVRPDNPELAEGQAARYPGLDLSAGAEPVPGEHGCVPTSKASNASGSVREKRISHEPRRVVKAAIDAQAKRSSFSAVSSGVAGSTITSGPPVTVSVMLVS